MQQDKNLKDNGLTASENLASESAGGKPNAGAESQSFKNSEPDAKVFDGTEKPIQQNLGDVLLGDLLWYLRENRLMSTLMVCRQIEKIELQNDVAQLYSSTTDLTELVTNDRHKTELDKFFKSKGLSFKLLEKKKEIDPIDTLREFFGEKLIVK